MLALYIAGEGRKVARHLPTTDPISGNADNSGIAFAVGLADDESVSRPETGIELCVSLKPERVDSMNMCQIAAISVRLLLTLFLIAAPLSAQRRRPATPKPPPPAKPAQPALTFETFLLPIATRFMAK